MKQPKTDLFILSLWLMPACAATTDQAPGKERKPNVIIIYTDDQGTLDAGCFGAKDLYTPNLDRLAKSGIRFTQAYAQTVSCPSRAALLTGRHPQRCGINNWTQNDAHAAKRGVNMPLSEVTIAEVLKENGYRTGLFGKWHLGAALENGPIEQGFDEFYGFRGGFIDNYVHYFLHGKGFHDLWDNNEEIFERGNYFPEQMTEKAIGFIERNRDHPFFLYAAFNLPHYPEQPDSALIARYAGLPEPRRSYAMVVTTVDDKIGRLITKLEELGIRENTVILFMSDNGHSTEETTIRVDNHTSGLPKGTDYCSHGGGGFTGKWRGAKGSFLEGGIRVPAIISYPGHFRKNQVRDQVVMGLDFFPTICEITGSKLPDCQIDGHSLVPIIDSSKAVSKHEVLHFQWEDQWAVREGRWKLIVNGLDFTGRYANHPQKKEQMESPYLADLLADNPEEENQAANFPEIVNRLMKLHENWAGEVFRDPQSK
jgi:arylsulfatase A-like enzyme